ncbi:hypothetical protein CpipJ_CPIJ007330 [Culex quinquefasciatus]|uniref:Uncharacterized protein n=1 Tax=Culex quinquefasciatus TaxID=7176 RepID=B0WK98_CULQU|nr:hypothetical protein CpipJ_CPIJ007330 [Culex quinquefasciatus]|eukprot:XP_001849132.1 hypothetical protein CpipJ_CPIJ007330 [Culex quinquefasciatus]
MAAAHATRTTTRTTHISRRCVSTRTHAYDTTQQQQRSRSTQHSAAHTGVNTQPRVYPSSLAESQPPGRSQIYTSVDIHDDDDDVPYVPYTTSKQG